MEDILTSIRTSVEEETAKVAGGDGAGEDVLSLSDTDIVAEAGSAPTDDELIDIDAFANSGEAKPASNVAVGADPLGVNAPVAAPAAAAEPAPAPADAPAAAAAAPAPAGDEAKAAEDEFDRLLAELETPGAPAAEAPAAAAAPAAAPAVAVDEVVEEVVATPAPAPVSAPTPVAAAAPLPVSSGGRLELAAIESVDGLQVAFPAEVLAAALRPLVKDWVAENLPAVVERLVKDEIAKISAE